MSKTLFRILIILPAIICAWLVAFSPGGAFGATPRIELYVTSWCPYCKIAEKTLKLRGLPYTRYDVEHDSEGIKRYQQMGAGGVPIFRINGRIIRGFNIEALNAILGGTEDSSNSEDSISNNSLT